MNMNDPLMIDVLPSLLENCVIVATSQKLNGPDEKGHHADDIATPV
jgi:hypothetical protein